MLYEKKNEKEYSPKGTYIWEVAFMLKLRTVRIMIFLHITGLSLIYEGMITPYIETVF